jgi:hypothetical protein
MMKVLTAATAITIGGSNMVSAAAEPARVPTRYLVERTFPAGALDGVDEATKQKVNANNKSLGVTWEKSYTNGTKTKTYCVYTAPNSDAVRQAAKLNGMPADLVTAIPNDIKTEPKGAVQKIAPGNQRYLVRRAGAAQIKGDSDRYFGVKLLTSYGSADKSESYWVYEAPSFSAVENAAKASGTPFESIVEIPVTLYPN